MITKCARCGDEEVLTSKIDIRKFAFSEIAQVLYDYMNNSENHIVDNEEYLQRIIYIARSTIKFLSIANNTEQAN